MASANFGRIGSGPTQTGSFINGDREEVNLKSLNQGARLIVGRDEKSCCKGLWEVILKSREEVMVIKRKQVRKGAKKVKMPHVEFDMDAVKEIKKRKKRSQKK